jgi:hypothetical protein
MKRMEDGVCAIRLRMVNAFLMETREALVLIVTPDFQNSPTRYWPRCRSAVTERQAKCSKVDRTYRRLKVLF